MLHFGSKLLLLCLLSLSLSGLNAQNAENQPRRFSAAVVAGINLSQLEGDAAAGFNKVGANVGGRGGYFFDKRFELSMELLYSGKGSFCGRCFPRLNYDLHFAEIAVEGNFREWFARDRRDREYSRIVVGAGLSYNQLLAARVTQDGLVVPSMAAELRRHNTAVNVSATFFATRMLGFNFRWSYSLYSLRPRSAGSLIMHLLTMRLVFAF